MYIIWCCLVIAFRPRVRHLRASRQTYAQNASRTIRWVKPGMGHVWFSAYVTTPSLTRHWACRHHGLVQAIARHDVQGTDSCSAFVLSRIRRRGRRQRRQQRKPDAAPPLSLFGSIDAVHDSRYAGSRQQQLGTFVSYPRYGRCREGLERMVSDCRCADRGEGYLSMAKGFHACCTSTDAFNADDSALLNRVKQSMSRSITRQAHLCPMRSTSRLTAHRGRARAVLSDDLERYRLAHSTLYPNRQSGSKGRLYLFSRAR